jgi:hypothetical protein
MVMPCLQDMLKGLQYHGSNAVEFAGRKPMIRTQHDRGEPKLAHHPLAAYVDMRRFMTIKAVKEQTIRAWESGNRWHAIRLEQLWKGASYVPQYSFFAPRESA